MKALDHLDAGAPGAGSAVVAVGALGVVGKSLPFVAAAISNVHAARFSVRILAGKLVGAGAASRLNLRLLVAELNCQPLTSAVNLTLFAYTWMVLLPVAKW